MASTLLSAGISDQDNLKAAVYLSVSAPDSQTPDLLCEIALREEDSEGLRLVKGRATVALLDLGRPDLAVRAGMKVATSLTFDELAVFEEFEFNEDDIQFAIGEVDASGGSDREAVLMMGLVGKAMIVPRIHLILERTVPGSDLARACLRALYVSMDPSSSTEEAFLKGFAQPETEEICALGLLQLRTSGALAVLRSRLVETGASTLSTRSVPFLIARNLLRIDETRSDTARFLWDTLEVYRVLDIAQMDLMPFVELARPDVDEWIYDLAFSTGGIHSLFQVKRGAIEALALRDPARAFDAAMRLRELGSNEREEAPRLLLDLDAARALPVLQGYVETEAAVLMLAAIGESLVATGNSGALLLWLKDGALRLREGACIAAEFSPYSEELCQTVRGLLYDREWNVRNAANLALDRLWHAQETDRLVDAILSEKDASRQVRLLDEVVELGYPGLWARQPWVNRLWSKLGLSMRQRADGRLVARRKEVRDRLEKRIRSE